MTPTLIVIVILAVTTFTNILIPMSGSATVTPLLALVVEPHKAIGLASFLFVLSGIVRVWVFRHDIRWSYVKQLLIPSLAGAVVGALALVAIPPRVLLGLVLAFVIYFFIKTARNVAERPATPSRLTTWTGHFVGLFSGVLQGAGISGSDVRASFLYSEHLNLLEVRGTASFVGTANFLLATMIRLATGQLSVPDLMPLIWLFPVIAAAVLLGRHVLHQIDKKYSRPFTLLLMAVIVILLVERLIAG